MASRNGPSLISRILPPPGWRLPVTLLVAVFIGLGLTAFYISNASSYLSDDPNACINCHIMIPQYSTWSHSSHSQRANCNDCHVPHDNFIRKYFFKASDGIRHATFFTFRWEPQVIRINEPGKKVVQENCIRCHEHTVGGIAARDVTGDNYKHGEGHLCWDCHRETPHGKISSLASTPYVMAPSLEPVIPEWLENYTSKNNKTSNNK